MSVATGNPFAPLEAEDASRPSTPAPSPVRAVAPSSQQTRTIRDGNYNSHSRVKRSSHKEENPASEGADELATGDNRRSYESRGNDYRASNGRGNDGRVRGRGGRGGARRPFDRHSQTGKIDSGKKIHQSWGGDDGNTELKTEQQATADADLDGSNEWGNNTTPSADWGTMAESTAIEQTFSVDADKADGGRAHKERELEEEDNTLTFDQYLAQQKEKESVVPKLEGARQANDGADASIWKDIIPIEKDGEDAYFVGKSKTVPKTRVKKEEKVYLEIDAHFDRPERGGRGRIGRGGDRSRASRARGRSGGYRHSNPDVADESQFPSL